jgi:hypothetical protein
MEVHRSSIVCPWYIRIYAASYHKCDPRDDTKTKLRAADKRLTYPGTAPPEPHSEHRPQPGSRVSRQVCVPVGQEDRNLSHHTPHRAGPPDRDPGLEMRGADTQGPIDGLPCVIYATCGPPHRASVHCTSRFQVNSSGRTG